MGRRMNLLQLLDRDLGVNLGRAQLGMTQQLLDEPYVGLAFQHQGGAGVPEQDGTSPVCHGPEFLWLHPAFGKQGRSPYRKRGSPQHCFPPSWCNLHENGDESGHSLYPEGVYSHKR